MATTEHTINDALADLLRETRRIWRGSSVVKSENTGMIRESAARPDILIIEPNVSPVAVETEIMPAVSVEQETKDRLGKHLKGVGRPILSSVAVRLPDRLRAVQGDALREELRSAADLEMALYTGERPEDNTRWPASGWLRGTIRDLSILVQSASVPPAVIDAAADQLVEGVEEAAALLDEMAITHPGAMQRIGQELHQQDDPQTRRMAATILTNAFVFHGNLAGGQGALAQVKTLDELRGTGSGLSKTDVLDEWRKILTVNYWPIFDIARRILEVLPPEGSRELIESLTRTANRLLASRLMRSHDLTGAVFQRLIVDRKFLAAFYTTPASAALLVGLALRPNRTPAGKKWASAEGIKALRIADFACGTGTLLSTAYQRIGQLHEMAGGDAEKIHPAMMAEALVGCDVLPAAAHLTASMLAGAHPTVKYENSLILALPYGRQPEGPPALGALDLLEAQGRFEILNITSKALEGLGESEKQTLQALPHESFDLVIMNPPFTRATTHEGQHQNVPNPMFAAFGSSAAEQREMSNRIKALAKGTSAHGNAGEASIFLALADRKLDERGTLALVMPLTLLSGSSWEKSRELLATHYRDLIVVTIAGVGGAEMSFSADTGMGECLIVGRKTKRASKRAVFVSLHKPPQYPLLGYAAAEQVRRLVATRTLQRLEDGPAGGSVILFGDEEVGRAIDAPLPKEGGWNLARVMDFSLAQTAYQIASEKRLWLPGQGKAEAASVPMTMVERIAKIGPVHRDINGRNSDGSIRGPFEVVPLQAGRAPTYPMLWAHDADRERTMVFDADSEGIPYHGSSAEERARIERKVEAIAATASHCHANLDFRYNSQSTGMQFTPRKAVGGTAWPSVQLPTVEHEKALVLWANTTPGLLMHWWHASRQQSGRGRLTKVTLATLPVLDVTALRPDQLAAAVRLFDEMSNQPLRPVNEIADDPVRKALDEAFMRDVLGLPETMFEALDLLRRKLGQEPSVRGGK